MIDIAINEAASRPKPRARPKARPPAAKWSTRRTLAFIVVSSLALWLIILSPFLFF